MFETPPRPTRSICGLPEDTVRNLNSGQALVDPVALVKELVENSLDANATQVGIEVSANLLDSVLVRDNGSGIAPQDRLLVCLPHHTSKITSNDEIWTVLTFGFRGNALSSAAALSKELLFLTRAEGEPIAEVYTVGRDGPVARGSACAPIGTTVRAAGFLHGLPVRRQNMARKTRALQKQLKELVVRYFLARPHCRFSLKITSKSSAVERIIYVPAKSVPEAVRQAKGKDLAAACKWVVEGGDGIVVEAFVAKPGCNVAALENAGQYIYVDARPVSTTHGAMANIPKLYRSHIKASLPAGEAPGSPFIYLNVLCPRGSYDPNVEPAKDDVLFDADTRQRVRAVIEALFVGMYGAPPSTKESAGAVTGPLNSGFGPSLVRKDRPKVVNPLLLALPQRERDISRSPPSPSPALDDDEPGEGKAHTQSSICGLSDGV